MNNLSNASANTFPAWEKYDDTIQTVLVEKNDRPLVSMMIAFPFGSYVDPQNKEGLSTFMANMLSRGTKKHTRSQIEETLDFLGASLDITAGSNSFVLEAEVLAKNIPQLMDLIVEVLTQPTFDEVEIEKQKKEFLSQLQLKLESDSDLAKKNFMKTVYGAHPYGRDSMGTKESIQSFTKKDLMDHFHAYINRGQLLIGAAGSISKSIFFQNVKQIAQHLPQGTNKKIELIPSQKITGINVTLVDKPERSQNHFFIGHPSISVNHPDYFALRVFLNAFAGPMFQAQYMQEIRVKRGWSYGAYGSLDARKDGGAFYLYTYPKTTDTLPAIKVSLELLENAVNGNGLSDGAIEFARNSMARSFPFMIDLPEKVMSETMYNRLLGKSDDFLAQYRSKVLSITPQTARAVAKKYIDPKNLSIVILCTAKDIEKQVQAELHPTTLKVIPFDKR